MGTRMRRYIGLFKRKGIPRALIKKRKKVVEHLIAYTADDCAFNRGVRAALKGELVALEEILKG